MSMFHSNWFSVNLIISCVICYVVSCYEVSVLSFFHSVTQDVTFVFGTMKIRRIPSTTVRSFNAFSIVTAFPILTNPRPPPSFSISMKHSTPSTLYSFCVSHAG
jgi:dipeptide/tripeptide permease